MCHLVGTSHVRIPPAPLDTTRDAWVLLHSSTSHVPAPDQPTVSHFALVLLPDLFSVMSSLVPVDCMRKLQAALLIIVTLLAPDGATC